jgi:hypothetical protein
VIAFPAKAPMTDHLRLHRDHARDVPAAHRIRSQYLIATKDADGNDLDGAKSYRVTSTSTGAAASHHRVSA